MFGIDLHRWRPTRGATGRCARGAVAAEVSAIERAVELVRGRILMRQARPALDLLHAQHRLQLTRDRPHPRHRPDALGNDHMHPVARMRSRRVSIHRTWLGAMKAPCDHDARQIAPSPLASIAARSASRRKVRSTIGPELTTGLHVGIDLHAACPPMFGSKPTRLP